jgi:hypothetical protein
VHSISSRSNDNSMLSRLSQVPRRLLLRTATTTCRRHTSSTLIPSTIDTGFTLSLPPLPNPATSDRAYRRVLSWYLPQPILDQVTPPLNAFGKEAVSPQINEWIANAEREQPYIKTRNVWGAKYAHDRLVTSTGWKELGKWGIKNG